MKVGDVYKTKFDNLILVLEIAADESWAVIEVQHENGSRWTKRQELMKGKFAFPVTFIKHFELTKEQIEHGSL